MYCTGEGEKRERREKYVYLKIYCTLVEERWGGDKDVCSKI